MMGKRRVGLVQQLVGGAQGGKASPTLEAGVTFSAPSTSLAYQVDNNEDGVPTALQLSFNPAYLEAEADTQDDGAVASPCYVVEPGGSRDISLVRSGTCPTSGGPYAVTVTVTLASGTQIKETISVEPAASLLAVLGGLSPEHLWLFTDNGSGKVDNLGSAGATYDATLSGTTISTSARPAWEGEIEIDGDNDRAEISSIFPRDGAEGYVADRDRTLLWVWISRGHNNVRRVGGDVNRFSQASAGAPYVATVEGVSDFSMDASYDHTDGGSSESFLNTNDLLCVGAMSYDLVAQTWTVRWKQTGHRSGHSLRVITGIGPSAIAGTTWYRLIGGAGNAAGRLTGAAHLLMDEVLSGAEFDSIAATVGL